MAVGVRGRGRGRGRNRLMAEINVTPMVDVMLVLLIIFMVTAPLLTSGVNVDLPKTSASPLNQTDKPITVTVGALRPGAAGDRRHHQRRLQQGGAAGRSAQPHHPVLAAIMPR